MSTSLNYVIKFVADMDEETRSHAEKADLRLRVRSLSTVVMLT